MIQVQSCLLPAGRPAANPSHVTAAVELRDRQTDGQTDGETDRQLHRLCYARYTDNVNNAAQVRPTGCSCTLLLLSIDGTDRQTDRHRTVT